MQLSEKSILHAPPYSDIHLNDLHVLIDPEGPNWISTDSRGSRIYSYIDGKRNFSDIVKLYASEFGLGATKAWVHVNTFVKDALREKILSLNPFVRAPYRGRREYLKADRLSELWIHTNNSCNLQCTHCLVSSGPSEDKGLPTDDLTRIIDEARELGVFRFYFTGGEPFIRKDIFDLIEYVTRDEYNELIVLTNGMSFNKRGNINRLQETGRGRVKPQISLDGSNARANDPIRGKGTFEKITNGIKSAVQAGLSPTVTTVVNSHNAKDVPEITRLLASLGVKNHHLLWVHQTGRIMNGGRGLILPTYELIDVVKKVKKTADELGITVDNFETIRAKLRTRKFTKFDLSNSCWDSLCVYSDGEVYPSAALANTKELSSGNIKERPLKEIWKESKVFEMFRGATVQNRFKCSNCFLKFICGGGDIEHSYFFNRATFGKGDLAGSDPYSELHEYMIVSTMLELAEEKATEHNNKSGFDAPRVFLAMGEGTLGCGMIEINENGIRNRGPGSNSDFNIELSHSNCVLTFDVDKSREVVREFYGKAAEQPQKELCCPTSYPTDDISHIPNDVIERFYGCGSPISIASLKPGETVVDLGSGAGIDCFIAAKMVGKDGRVVGVDMTDEMLGVANKCRATVKKNLGYDVVEFRKGFLEEIPVENKTVDLITSNCVINLSPDKKRVFSEMWRILKNHGRIVISDIVSEREVPEYIVTNEDLWGECIAGSLTEEQFISYLEQAGFYGLELLNKIYWKNVENHRFYSITVRGYKFEKSPECVYVGQSAIYLGPLKAIADEEGHLFPRNEAVEICTDTAEKLAKPPYEGMFIITDPTREVNDDYRCCLGEGNCC